MDPLILAEKLEALRYCIARIEQKRADSPEELERDADRQDILSLNLTRAVQLCVDMAVHVLSDTDQPAAQTMGEAFDRLVAEGVISDDLGRRMRNAVGFRNVAVHNYQVVNWSIVHAVSHDGLEDIREYANCMAYLLDE